MRSNFAEMTKSELELLIRGYVSNNYTEHPTAFPDSITEITTLSKELALSYWDHRTGKEVKRDGKLGITEADYQNWVQAEMMELKKEVLYN